MRMSSLWGSDGIQKPHPISLSLKHKHWGPLVTHKSSPILISVTLRYTLTLAASTKLICETLDFGREKVTCLFKSYISCAAVGAPANSRVQAAIPVHNVNDKEHRGVEIYCTSSNLWTSTVSLVTCGHGVVWRSMLLNPSVCVWRWSRLQ